MSESRQREQAVVLTQTYPNAHLLQLPEWAEFKSHFGWESQFFSNQSAAAQVLFRSLPAGFTIAYLPKGPLGINWSSFGAINRECQRRKSSSCR